MKIKFIKNFYSLFNALAIFMFITVILLIILFFVIPSRIPIELLISFLALEILLILVLFFLRKHLLTTVHIIPAKIVVQYFSKELQSFKLDIFDKVEFAFEPHNRSPIIEFYKNNDNKPILKFHITKKRLFILKKLDGFKPLVKEKIQKANYTFFGGVKIN